MKYVVHLAAVLGVSNSTYNALEPRITIDEGLRRGLAAMKSRFERGLMSGSRP
jgi:hypothetical protein